MGLEQLFFLVLVLFAALVQFLAPRLRQRWEELARRAGSAEAPGPRVHVAPQAPRARLAEPPASSHSRRTRRSPAPGPRRPRALGGLADVRRGIVLMTILGPCRALETPESHRPDSTG